MAHAYTPGLRVAADTIIRKQRLLPIPGQVVVAQGERVTAQTQLAHTELPGAVYPVNVVNRLSIAPAEVHAYLRKREGESIEKGEVLAENTPWLRWLQTQVRAPVSGTVDSISTVSGQVFLRAPAEVIRLSAYIDGTVVEVIPGQGAVPGPGDFRAGRRNNGTAQPGRLRAGRNPDPTASAAGTRRPDRDRWSAGPSRHLCQGQSPGCSRPGRGRRP
ncbi:MAG: hypothetical protein J4F42_15190 [Desulfurellaceae bacterium]|nr:hypothetical protein [Desulfurellaceae bacterium]